MAVAHYLFGQGYAGDPYEYERLKREQEMLMRQYAAMQNSQYNSLNGHGQQLGQGYQATPKEEKPNLLLLLEEI